METKTFLQELKPSKYLLKGFIIWIGLNFIILFFSYSHLGVISNKIDKGEQIFLNTGERYHEYEEQEIWIINMEPDVEKF